MANVQEEWLEKAISEEHINYINYNKFTDPIVIGIGGFGKVLKYEWRDGGLTVALKCLKDDTVVDESIIKGFIDELKLLRKVSNHQNVISFYGVTKDNNGYYNMVLLYADDGTLRDYLMLNFTKLQWTDKLCMAKEIALGLLYLHENDIIHRDLHSKNILIHQRQPKITDFGLSKRINEITSNSNAFGMPAYVEPQCLVNDKYKRNMKSDVYSLGVILWEISSGKSPFPSFESVLSLAVHIYRGNREEPIEGTPSQYIQLYKQCWDNDPANRPETGSIVNDLKQINPNETSSQQRPIEASAEFFENLRIEAHKFFEQGKFLKALDLFEEILKNCQLSPEDQESATAWDLSRNRGFENFSELIMVLHKNTTLTSLDLGSNELGSFGGKLLSEALYKNTTLTSLILKENNLGSKGGKLLSEVLCKNTTLTSLDLDSNELGSEGGKALASALCINTTLTSLNLDNNNLGSEGGEALADALCSNRSLTFLNIRSNNLGLSGYALFEVFYKKNTLKNLDIRDNNLKGGEAIVDALCKNTALTSLDLSSNGLGSKEVKILANLLCNFTTLTSLNLYNNILGSEGGKALADALCKNSTLKDLNLTKNILGSEGGKALADALCKNSTLTSLLLFYNNLGSEGGKALADALCKNSTLTSLNLYTNNLGSEGGKALADALCKNSTLKDLKIYFENNIGFKLISNNSDLKIE
ncbi:kinase-like domain-containing protein [Gigaspora rosea]|uniref:Kinase-like domain-containing protein n=1 Tax=Gigaspora rosea TaxID=44941 RepID=A0A397TZR8_9GLOM|nr:kinase-like domain-containing protein [Gigaspora rosea]